MWFLTEERIDRVGEIKGLPRPVSENLILSSDTLSSMYFSAFLDGIIWSCRPKDGLEEVSFESFEVTLKSGGLCPGKLL
ncbi:hypothetical protein BUALT_Bualt14G0081000 [Buddleja alternifolia]|uniref:Uncharacterized protein n=1 Tax=Buddleja alternifolia TaxID=168488 RepID=A0AAV6WIQ2_9LAMI|nr:hypothetical protein BUALT_Bualt14G0079200 [Buddleja alternifolia]KAG8370086.1 hypothetical protein BUALT_Bualt14G0081000 [Buddleja alternifolia]